MVLTWWKFIKYVVTTWHHTINKNWQQTNYNKDIFRRSSHWQNITTSYSIACILSIQYAIKSKILHGNIENRTSILHKYKYVPAQEQRRYFKSPLFISNSIIMLNIRNELLHQYQEAFSHNWAFILPSKSNKNHALLHCKQCDFMLIAFHSF